MSLKQRRAPITSRIERLQSRVINTKRRLNIERARLFTECFKENIEEPLIIRRALCLEHILKNISIAIEPDELIVGDRTAITRSGDVSPEMAVNWIDDELDHLNTRPQDRFFVSEQDIAELREEMFPFWKGNTLHDHIIEVIDKKVKRAVEEGVFVLNQTDHGQGHILPNIEKWINKGVEGIRDGVKDKLETCGAEEKIEAVYFCRALLITLDAAELFIKRHADLAREMAGKAPIEERDNLLVVHEVCRRIAVHPARNFREAVQALWFLIVILQIESNVTSISPGRIDQYLLPYYEKDLRSGVLTQNQAQEIIENLWINFNRILFLRSSESAKYYAGFPMGFNVTIGGQTREGDDATNELSYMCLRAQEAIGLPQPNLSVRLYNHTPEELLLKAARVISYGDGQPQIFNDEVIIPALLNRGYSLDEARNYALIGCVEISVPGNTMGITNASMMNLVKILELTMNNGISRTTKREVGLKSGKLSDFSSFDEFEEAFEAQLEHFIKLMVRGCRDIEKMHARYAPTPFLSCVIDNCVEEGRDVTNGGALYNFSGIQGVQPANIADSLIAIKKILFEDKLMSADRLNDLLDRDFEGNEETRHFLLNSIPKYGNDIASVDGLAHRWARKFCKAIERYENWRGGIFQPGFYTVSAYIPMGAMVGATPDGRKAKAPLADGGLSPMRGVDLKGPTAVLKSVSKIDLMLASNGSLLNMKFMPSFFEGEKALELFASFLKTFVDLKIQHIQFNVVSTDTLRSAQEEPQNYHGLVVRVAGYSAFFVELAKELQEEIILRTAYSGS